MAEVQTSFLGPAATGLYGNPYSLDTLYQMNIGQAGADGGRKISYRFRATQASGLSTFRVYLQNGTQGAGYGAGTGGTVQTTLQTDNGAGLPSGTVLATANFAGSPWDAGKIVTFSVPYTLNLGSLYHLVFKNIDANPSANNCSVNATYQWAHPVQIQPRWTNNDDWGACYKDGTGAWKRRDGAAGDDRAPFTPILDIGYTNGVHYGQGYMEWWGRSGQYGTITGTTQRVRERFTTTSTLYGINKMAVRVRRTAGTSPLTLRLETSAGVLVAEGNVAAASVPVSSPGSDNIGQTWGSVTLVSSVNIPVGTYNFLLYTAAGTTYTINGIAKGSSYGYTAATYFNDGYAQKTTDGTNWGYLYSGTRNDIAFYLTGGSAPANVFSPSVTSVSTSPTLAAKISATGALYQPTVVKATRTITLTTPIAAGGVRYSPAAVRTNTVVPGTIAATTTVNEPLVFRADVDQFVDAQKIIPTETLPQQGVSSTSAVEGDLLADGTVLNEPQVTEAAVEQIVETEYIPSGLDEFAHMWPPGVTLPPGQTVLMNNELVPIDSGGGMEPTGVVQRQGVSSVSAVVGQTIAAASSLNQPSIAKPYGFTAPYIDSTTNLYETGVTEFMIFVTPVGPLISNEELYQPAASVGGVGVSVPFIRPWWQY